MIVLQLTQRKHSYQLEVLNHDMQTRMRVSPRFVNFEPAELAFDNVTDELKKKNTKIKDQLLTYAGDMYAQQPSTIHKWIQIT